MQKEDSGKSSYQKYGRPVLYGLVAAVITGVLGYMAYDALRPVDKVAPALSGIQSGAPEPSSPVLPAEKSNYSVPADHPRLLTIEKIGISARIVSMGVTPGGALDAPKTSWDVGWYKESAKPGIGVSALLMDGHVNDTRNTLGIFGQLHVLNQGDIIGIERGDGQQFTYRVVKREQVSVQNVDMSALMKSIIPGKQGLNLITCGGVYDAKTQAFSDRILVFAEQV